MKKIITPRIFRSLYNRAIVEIILKGLNNYQTFMVLGIQSDFFTNEDFNSLKDLYNQVYNKLIQHFKDINS